MTLTGGSLWTFLKQVESHYLQWRSEYNARQAFIEGRKPVKHGHLHLLNEFRGEELVVDYRIFVQIDENGDESYRLRSCVLQVDEVGFESVDLALQWFRNGTEGIRDECGFSLSVADEDDEAVYEFTPPLVYPEEPIFVPPNTAQVDWQS